MEKVNIGNKTLTLENIKNKNEIHFSLSDDNKIYSTEEEIKDLFEFFEDDILKNINNFEFKIKKSSNQDSMNLTIKCKENGKTRTLCLNFKNDSSPEGPAPVNYDYTPKKNDLEKKIEEIKNNYNDTLKEIKEKNKQLMKENEELQKEIDKEKRKNDEILRVYFENREKYENAVKKNSEIAELQSKL